MTTDQLLILFILAASVAMFLWGRWRHDMVAVGALLAAVLGGLVPAFDAFTGFPEGKATMAQGGGPEINQLDLALKVGRERIIAALHG